jgi:hypothetical protein
MRVMDMTCTAFAGDLWIATGSPEEVRKALRAVDPAESGLLLVFDDETGRQIDLDMRESVPARSRGRPKLGVTAGEVTLLPRHWEWLKAQPGGASSTIRRLIDAARKRPADARRSKDAAYHFMSAIAGDRYGYEDAIRALYAADRARFETLTGAWPVGIRDHARSLAEGAFA